MAKKDFRFIPSVDQVKGAPALARLFRDHPESLVTQAIREVIQQLREELTNCSIDKYPLESGKIEGDYLAGRTAQTLARILQPSLVPVINATGVIIHTNLGRAPLSRQVWSRMEAVATGYSNLEYDLAAGGRGSRFDHLSRSLRRITGAQEVLVVNNNAAAVLLVLTALARGREVLVSRSELIEIGGSFRLPDVMAQGGAILREVGTTNKVHLSDFESAMGPETGMILKAHQSNFSIQGFSSEVSRTDLQELATGSGVPFYEDLGSGLLEPLDVPGMGEEDDVVSVVAAGVDIVSFSGDKMLGGPQAGVIVGKQAYIDCLRRHPLTRALRPDKLTLVGLEAAVNTYLDGQTESGVPVLRMIRESQETTRRRAGKLLQLLLPLDTIQGTIVDCHATVGGGAQPGSRLPSAGIRVTSTSMSATALEAALRAVDVPIIARLEQDAVVMDLRTISDGELDAVVEGLSRVAGVS